MTLIAVIVAPGSTGCTTTCLALAAAISSCAQESVWSSIGPNSSASVKLAGSDRRARALAYSRP